MKHEITIASKLSAAICAVLLLASFVAGAHGLRNRKPERVADQDNYQYYTINHEGSAYGFFFGINNSGLASGVYSDANGDFYSFLWRDGHETPVTYPGSTVTLMGNVNDSGLVFGNVGDWTVQHAAILKLATGRWTLLPDITGRLVNVGNRTNNRGIGVGTACVDWGLTDCLGWTWDGKAYSFTNIPGTKLQSEGPYGINDQGDEVGSFQDDNGTIHAYLSTKWGFTQIDMPGATSTYGVDINDKREILLGGLFSDGSGKNGIWREGVFEQLPAVPDATSTITNGFNDNGDYCGQYTDASGATHPFVAIRKSR
jgi:hypothetical protein